MTLIVLSLFCHPLPLRSLICFSRHFLCTRKQQRRVFMGWDCLRMRLQSRMDRLYPVLRLWLFHKRSHFTGSSRRRKRKSRKIDRLRKMRVCASLSLLSFYFIIECFISLLLILCCILRFYDILLVVV